MGPRSEDRISEATESAFARFVVSASPRLLRSAYLLIGDRGHAEDLLQTALWRTLRRWDAITGSPESYALKVLVNLSRDAGATWHAGRERPEPT
jgi:DNA-directed RNA polymerase specialized sigma24 family protein